MADILYLCSSYTSINGAERECSASDLCFMQVCKYFLDAIENNKYGWFWVCPGGGDNCMYRHALPPGFVLKKDKKKEEKQDEISLEDLIEKEVKLSTRYLLVVFVFIILKRR